MPHAIYIKQFLQPQPHYLMERRLKWFGTITKLNCPDAVDGLVATILIIRRLGL